MQATLPIPADLPASTPPCFSESAVVYTSDVPALGSVPISDDPPLACVLGLASVSDARSRIQTDALTQPIGFGTDVGGAGFLTGSWAGLNKIMSLTRTGTTRRSLSAHQARGLSPCY